MRKRAFGKTKEFYKELWSDFMWALITFVALVFAYFDWLHIGIRLSLILKTTSDTPLITLITAFSYIPVVLILGGLLVFVADIAKSAIFGIPKDEIMNSYISSENPHILIIHNKDQDWEHCRLRLEKVDDKYLEHYLLWNKGVVTATSPVTEENCLTDDKISIDLIGVANQSFIKEFNSLHGKNKNTLFGIHELKLKFIASRKNGESIFKELSVKVRFARKFIPGKENKFQEGRILKITQ